jgi:hypothetical protein
VEGRHYWCLSWQGKSSVPSKIHIISL